MKISPCATLATGQQALSTDPGNGGTFIARRVNNIFEPVMVAGGAAGTFDDIEPEDILMANGRTDEFGENSNFTKHTRIGRSSGSADKHRYTGGAGFYASPSLENVFKKTVGDTPKLWWPWSNRKF